MPWIPSPYPNLRSHFGIGQAMYTLVFGQSSAGKSAFVHWTYVLGPYGWWKRHREETDIKLKIFAYVLERPKIRTLAKWTALQVMLHHKMLLDVNTILGFGTAKSRLTDEAYELIKGFQEYFDEMLDETVTLIDIPEPPTDIFKRMRRWAYDNGAAYQMNDKGEIRKAYLGNEERKAPHGIRIEEVEKWRHVPNPIPEQIPTPESSWNYIPDDENLITLVIIDHIGLVPRERTGHYNAQKGNLDRLSGYCQQLRDYYGFSPVLVSQSNRNIQSVYRRTNVGLEPEAQDIEGSSRMYHDADVVLGLINPHKYRLDRYKGYEVSKFVDSQGHNRFRALKILKNSYGPDDLVKGMLFVGETGYFEELPKPGDMTDSDYKRRWRG